MELPFVVLFLRISCIIYNNGAFLGKKKLFIEYHVNRNKSFHRLKMFRNLKQRVYLILCHMSGDCKNCINGEAFVNPDTSKTSLESMYTLQPVQYTGSTTNSKRILFRWSEFCFYLLYHLECVLETLYSLDLF